jgi:hypothetical protein
MQGDKHSGQRMLDLVQEVRAASAEHGHERDETEADINLDIGLLESLSEEDFDLSSVLERLISGARRN